MSDRLKLKLKHPVVLGDEVVDELAFRAPKGKDFRGLKMDAEAQMDVVLTLGGKLCGQPTQVMDELAWADLQEVAAIVGRFMGGGPETGGADSPS